MIKNPFEYNLSAEKETYQSNPSKMEAYENIHFKLVKDREDQIISLYRQQYPNDPFSDEE